MDASFLLVRDVDFDQEDQSIKSGDQPREFTTWGLIKSAKEHFKVVKYMGNSSKGNWHYRFLKPVFGHWRARGIPLIFASWRSRNDFDIVVGMKDVALSLGLWKRLKGFSKPFVVAIEYRLMPPIHGWQGKLRKWLIKEAYRGVDLLVSNSRLQVEPFRNKLDSTRVIYCPRGVDIRYFDPKSSYSLPVSFASWGNFKKTILCPGDMERNDPLLLDSIADLPVRLYRVTREPKVVGRVQRLLSEPSRRLLRTRVKILFDIPWHKLRALYATSDLVVIPVDSSTQPAGLSSLLEAMAMGRPIVVSRGLSSHGYVRNGKEALVVEPNSIDALRGAIQSLLNTPEFANKLGKNARSMVESKFNIDTCADFFMQTVIKAWNSQRRIS